MTPTIVTRISLVTVVTALAGCGDSSPVTARFAELSLCKADIDGNIDPDCDPLPGDTGSTGDGSSGGSSDGSGSTTNDPTYPDPTYGDTTYDPTYGNTTYDPTYPNPTYDPTYPITTYDPTYGSTTYDDSTTSTTYDPTYGDTTYGFTTLTDPSGGSETDFTAGNTTWSDTSGDTSGETSGYTSAPDPSDGDTSDPSGGSDTLDPTGYDTIDPTGYDTTGTTGDETSGGDTGSSGTTGGDCDPNQNAGKKPCPTYWVQAPRAISTAHIAKFNPATVAGFLLKQEPWKTAAAEIPGFATTFEAMITGLAASANSDPPKSFSSGGIYGVDYPKWIKSKEYRGFLDNAAFKIHCDANTGKLTPKPCEDGTKLSHYYDGAMAKISLGYTKEPGIGFTPGEPHASGPGGKPPMPATKNDIAAGDRAGKNTDKCITHTSYYSSRLANPARTAQAAISQYDAPFIYQELSTTVCCDGTYDVQLKNPVFPTASLYINMDQVAVHGQFRLADFIRSGSLKVEPAGQGPQAPAAPNPLSATGKARKIDACDGTITQEYTPKPSVAP